MRCLICIRMKTPAITLYRKPQRYSPGTALSGCYGFSVNGYSRAFNPAGGDPSDPQAHDWFYDATWLIWNQFNLSVAVVDV